MNSIARVVASLKRKGHRVEVWCAPEAFARMYKATANDPFVRYGHRMRIHGAPVCPSIKAKNYAVTIRA